MTEKKNKPDCIALGRYFRLVLLLLLAVSEHARAQYIDPGSGSYILQLLLAGFLAFAFYSGKVKDYIKHLFSKVFSKK